MDEDQEQEEERRRVAALPGAGIDRTAIRRLLAMTPAERILLLVEEVRNLEQFDRLIKR
jgi:hypothetical protein